MDSSLFLTADPHSPHSFGNIDIEFAEIPPSPPYESFELSDGQHSDILSPPPGGAFSHTPSYGSGPGSLGGSPRSNFSDLDYSDDPINGSLLLFPDFPEYNPSDFDHASPQYMMFSNSVYGDYSSPSSNGGSPNLPPASLQASPRMEVQQSFENMSFSTHQSPSWGTEPLPDASRPSPPRLLMPDDESGYQQPSINAPDGDGAGGPHLRVVPATPVSGGLNNNGAMYMRPSQSQTQQPWMQSTPSPAPPPISQQNNGAQHLSQHEQFNFPPRPSSTSLYIPPTPGRSRSKSDSSPGGLPTWDTLGLGGGGLGLSGVTSSFKDESAVSDQPYSFNTDFLAPSDPSSLGLRRSRSDVATGNRPGHVRGSRSDDFGSSSYLMPPDSFGNGNYLTPDSNRGMNMNMGSGALMGLEGASIRGRHHRRASSGSRSERGVSSQDVSPGNSNRGSPYPSPNVSPRNNYDDLPGGTVNVGGQAIPLNVSKQNVTTGRTKVASHNRRKQEASFCCPVPGCGSTFTRSFNLKGHIRSHNEEKPFVCPWPGCNKGFARQHDCKRHEQLHSNYRPFQCEGCQKPFARMDALNRHLRSEGGLECAKLLEGKGLSLPLLPHKMETMPKSDEWDSGL